MSTKIFRSFRALVLPINIKINPTDIEIHPVCKYRLPIRNTLESNMAYERVIFNILISSFEHFSRTKILGRYRYGARKFQGDCKM